MGGPPESAVVARGAITAYHAERCVHAARIDEHGQMTPASMYRNAARATDLLDRDFTAPIAARIALGCLERPGSERRSFTGRPILKQHDCGLGQSVVVRAIDRSVRCIDALQRERFREGRGRAL